MALSLLPIRDTSLTGLRVMRGKRQVGTILRRAMGWEWLVIRQGYGPIKVGRAVTKRAAIARLTQAVSESERSNA